MTSRTIQRLCCSVLMIDRCVAALVAVCTVLLCSTGFDVFQQLLVFPFHKQLYFCVYN